MILFFCLVLTGVLSACQSQYESVTTPIYPELDYTLNQSLSSALGIQTVIEENEGYTLSVHYPLTGNLQIDLILETFTHTQTNDFMSRYDSAAKESLNLPYELHIDYVIKYRSVETLSILFTERVYLGGEDSVITQETFNFDLNRGLQIEIEDLFDQPDQALERLSQFVFNQLWDNQLLGVPLDQEWVTKGTSPTATNYEDFYLTDQGLVLLFRVHQVGDATLGRPEILVPYEVYRTQAPLENLAKSFAGVATEASQDTKTLILPSRPGSIKRKKIAITFEDGPHPLYTPLILDTLKSRSQKATFYVIGSRASDYDDLILRMSEENHLIGNHSWSHPQLTRVSESDLQDQIVMTQDVITQITGKVPTTYRPPYGIYNIDVIYSANMPTILWSIDPMDLKYKDAEFISNYVLDHAFDGAIVMLHDTNPYTTQALSGIIDGLVNNGYDLVTVEEILNLNASEDFENNRVYSRGTESN